MSEKIHESDEEIQNEETMFEKEQKKLRNEAYENLVRAVRFVSE